MTKNIININKNVGNITLYVEDNAGNTASSLIVIDPYVQSELLRSLSDSKEYVKQGLILYFDGINNTGSGHSSTTTVWKDLSGNNNNGILYGFNYNVNSGWNQNYLNFNNDNSEWGDYILIPSIVNIPAEYTIEFIIKYNDYYDKTWHGISFIGTRSGLFGGATGDGQTGFEVWGYGSNGNCMLTVKDSLDNIYTNQIGSNGIIAMNSFKKVTLTKILTNATIFVNDTKYTKKTFANSINATVAKTTLIINGRSGSGVGGSYQFRGNVYGVRIYNRELTDVEIKQNYIIDIEKYGL